MPARKKRAFKNNYGGDFQCMNKRSNPLLRAVKKKTLAEHLCDYLASCAPADDTSKKGVGKIPNLAGFCRHLSCGVGAYLQFADTYPELADYLSAVFEDEALNFSPSPTVLSAYLKKRLGYGEKAKSDEGESETDCGLMRLVFEHDIEEDGE